MMRDEIIRDEIIRMALEAGIDYGFGAELERFAALVISHHVKETRPEVAENMAEWLQQIAYQHGGIGDLSRTEMEFGAMVAAAEREAAVKDAERYRHAMREAMYLLDQPEPRPHAAFSELLLALNPAIDNRKKSAMRKCIQEAKGADID